MYSCCVTGFLTWYLTYQSSKLYNNYYVAVINLFLIKNCVLKVYLNILIKNIWLVLGLAQTDCKHFKRKLHRVVKHTQTISRQFLCVRFVWVCMTFFVGLVLKGLRMSIITFFIDIFLIDIMLWCIAASIDLMLLFIEIYVTLLFPNLKLNFLSVFFFIYKSLILFHYFKLSKSLHFLFIYLSMPIDNLIWQARVCIFNSLKQFFKPNVKNRGMQQFLLHHTVYSLYLFLTFYLIVHNLVIFIKFPVV